MGHECSEYRINVLLCCFLIVNCCELYCGSCVSNLLYCCVVLSMHRELVHKIILFCLLALMTKCPFSKKKKKKRERTNCQI